MHIPYCTFELSVKFKYFQLSRKSDSKLRCIEVIDIVSSQLYVCHILVNKKCQLQAGIIHPRPLA